MFYYAHKTNEDGTRSIASIRTFTYAKIFETEMSKF